ncbi:MAG: RluA family pseudouridine synthase, partial [bacterium]|nr:RluA family pseudouridine synthase [bacterium]
RTPSVIFKNLRYPVSMQLEPKILHEDKNILLIDKPAGMLVHGIYHKGEAKHHEETLVDWLVTKYPEIKNVGDVPSQRGGIVHRLDRETSGVMVIARTQEAFHFLKKQFQNHTVQKTYQTLVWGRVKNDTGIINKPISIVDGTVRRTVFKGKMKREAITEYEVLRYYNLRESASSDRRSSATFTLVKVMPKTGRTHQIRVHLSSIGHSIVGDKLYGKKRQGLAVNGQMLNRHFLHASQIEFISPSGKKITATSELPDDLRQTLTSLTSESESGSV